MSHTIHTFALDGIVARHVRVTIEISPGLPAFRIIDLPEPAAQESRERVHAAIVNAGFEFPSGRMTVRLWPVRRRRSSPSIDLAIVAAVLGASGQVELPVTTGLIGGIRLDGSVSAVRGSLSIAEAAREHYIERLVVPAANAVEAGLIEGIDTVPLESVAQLRALAAGDWPTAPSSRGLAVDPPDGAPDLDDLRGRPRMHRALEVAAAGGHGLLMVGPRDAGTSIAARRMPSILPPMGPVEALDVARVASATGQVHPDRFPPGRPFRAPHHTIGEAGLIGGGVPKEPGEITRAHRGVLFLDDVAAFRAGAVEALRGPMRRGEVVIARDGEGTVFPCRFMLVATCLWSPDGETADGDRGDAPSTAIDLIGARIGDLVAAFDIRAVVAPPPPADIAGSPGESSAAVRERVATAREWAEVRLGHGRSNGEMGRAETRRLVLDVAATKFLAAYRAGFPLGDRAAHPILRVARTLADLDGVEIISRQHLEEAISLR